MIDMRGVYKLGDYELIKKGLSAYFRLYSGQTDRCYLAPELLMKLKKREIRPKVNSYKADVFSMGMVLLQCATLKGVQSCYYIKQGKLNNDIIQRALSSIGHRYSHQL